MKKLTSLIISLVFVLDLFALAPSHQEHALEVLRKSLFDNFFGQDWVQKALPFWRDGSDQFEGVAKFTDLTKLIRGTGDWETQSIVSLYTQAALGVDRKDLQMGYDDIVSRLEEIKSNNFIDFGTWVTLLESDVLIPFAKEVLLRDVSENASVSKTLIDSVATSKSYRALGTSGLRNKCQIHALLGEMGPTEYVALREDDLDVVLGKYDLSEDWVRGDLPKMIRHIYDKGGINVLPKPFREMLKGFFTVNEGDVPEHLWNRIISIEEDTEGISLGELREKIKQTNPQMARAKAWQAVWTTTNAPYILKSYGAFLEAYRLTEDEMLKIYPTYGFVDAFRESGVTDFNKLDEGLRTKIKQKMSPTSDSLSDEKLDPLYKEWIPRLLKDHYSNNAYEKLKDFLKKGEWDTSIDDGLKTKLYVRIRDIFVNELNIGLPFEIMKNEAQINEIVNVFKTFQAKEEKSEQEALIEKVAFSSDFLDIYLDDIMTDSSYGFSNDGELAVLSALIGHDIVRHQRYDMGKMYTFSHKDYNTYDFQPSKSFVDLKANLRVDTENRIHLRRLDAWHYEAMMPSDKKPERIKTASLKVGPYSINVSVSRDGFETLEQKCKQLAPNSSLRELRHLDWGMLDKGLFKSVFALSEGMIPIEAYFTEGLNHQDLLHLAA